MGIGLTAYTGPEGSGKTLRMAADCLAHVNMGGKLFTFPGFHVLNDKGKEVGETITLMDMASMDKERFHGVLIATDEIQNFFDAMAWASNMVKIAKGIQAQRRKRRLGWVFTVQDMMWLPKPLRQLCHMEVACWDMFWGNHNSEHQIARGKQFRVSECDRKGFWTGTPFTWGAPYIFYGEQYWKNYDTEEVVDIWEQFTKINVKKRVMEVNPWQYLEDQDEVAARADKPVPSAIPDSVRTMSPTEIITGLMERGATAAEIAQISKGLRTK